MSITISVLENFDIYGCFAYITDNGQTFSLFAPSYLGSIWKQFKAEKEAKLEFDTHFLYLFNPDYPPEWSDFFVPPDEGNFLSTHYKFAYLKNSVHFFNEPVLVNILDCVRKEKRFRLVAISAVSGNLIYSKYFDRADECFQAFLCDFGSNTSMTPDWILTFTEIEDYSIVAANRELFGPAVLPGGVAADGLGPHIRNEAAPWPKNSSEET